MILERVRLDLTPAQAELVLASLRDALMARYQENRADSSDNYRIRAVITDIKEQL